MLLVPRYALQAWGMLGRHPQEPAEGLQLLGDLQIVPGLQRVSAEVIHGERAVAHDAVR